jgi:BirA family biotin operon repressor/biotin-[acetyl-CoA-carboxylase] ligase
MLKSSLIGDVIIELSEIDSTNNYAMRLIDEGMAEHGMTIRADFQTKGKGQFANLWLAEESKNLLISIIIDTKAFAIEKQFFLNAATCLSVAEMLMTNYNIPHVSIKWPNDIYAGDKKIAGILIENSLRGTQWTNAVVGIGLNVNQAVFSDLNRATSILNETNVKQKVNLVLKNVLKIVNKQFLKIGTKEHELFESFNLNLYKLNKEILFIKKNEMYKGIIKGVNVQGELELEVEGKMKRFKHKEIELVLS